MPDNSPASSPGKAQGSADPQTDPSRRKGPILPSSLGDLFYSSGLRKHSSQSHGTREPIRGTTTLKPPFTTSQSDPRKLKQIAVDDESPYQSTGATTSISRASNSGKAIATSQSFSGYGAAGEARDHYTMPQEEKENILIRMFPNLELWDITEIFERCSGDLDKAIYKLNLKKITKEIQHHSITSSSEIKTANPQLSPPEPQSKDLYVVLFKCYRADVFWATNAFGSSTPGVPYKPEDFVVVEADRGTDLGKIAHKVIDLATANAFMEHYAREHRKTLIKLSQHMPGASDRNRGTFGSVDAPTQQQQDFGATGMKPSKRIVRLAQPDEIKAHQDKTAAEDKAKQVCTQKAKERGLHMEILEAEFQLDRKRLDFYCFADEDVNISPLLADLFKTYKTEIWMANLSLGQRASPDTYRVVMDSHTKFEERPRATERLFLPPPQVGQSNSNISSESNVQGFSEVSSRLRDHWREDNNELFAPTPSTPSSSKVVPEEHGRMTLNNADNWDSIQLPYSGEVLSDSDIESVSSSFEEAPSTFGRNKLNTLQKVTVPKLTLATEEWQSPLKHPRSYYGHLAKLKSEIYENSAINVLARSGTYLNAFSTSETPARIALQATTLKSSERRDLFQSSDKRAEPEERRLLKLMEVANIMDIVVENLNRLQEGKFADEHISIFFSDFPIYRRNNVASCARISISDIRIFVAKLHGFLLDELRGSRHSESTWGFWTVPRIEELLPSIKDFFRSRGTSLYFMRLTNSKALLDEMYNIACLLDLAVITYASAHMENIVIDTKIFAPDMDGFEIPGFLGRGLGSSIVLRRCRTSCLDAFLDGQKIWVFCPPLPKAETPFYVSISAGDFADIWGPVWEVHDKSDAGWTTRYDVGTGFIVPWTHDRWKDPMLLGGEAFYHFVPKDHPAAALSGHEVISLISGKSISKIERLLIGPPDQARVSRRRRQPPMSWSECSCDIRGIEDKLRRRNRLQPLGTLRSYTYVDSRTVGIGAGTHGITAAGSMSIKRMKGVSFKEVFVSSWEKQPETRHPQDLAHRWGVAISLCTWNAERVSIFKLLNAESTRRYLSRFRWSDMHRRDRFEAALDTGLEALCTLWDGHPDWQDEMGKALLYCFQALASTGFDANRKEFVAFWVTPSTTLPKQVFLKPSEHNWVEFLQDTEVSFTVAVMVEECLGTRFSRHAVQTCGSPSGRSALQTSICINDDIEPSQKLIRLRPSPSRVGGNEKWDWTWDVSRLESGDKFPILLQGRLKTIEPLTKSRVLVECDFLLRKTLLESMGMNWSLQTGHWEYTELVEYAVRPIPVYVRSSSEMVD